MFDMRRREEALGDKRIMGSGRRAGFLGLLVRVEFEGVRVAVIDVDEGAPGREGRERERKVSAVLRTCEKSVGLIPRSTLFLSPMRRSPL